MLLLLLSGDIFAVTAYFKSVDWKVLIKLIPHVVIGIIAGAVFLKFTTDDFMKKFIGILIILMTLGSLLKLEMDKKIQIKK